jgi:hypothetical protein
MSDRTQTTLPAAPRELTTAELRAAAGGALKLPGLHKSTDVTLKRGLF